MTESTNDTDPATIEMAAEHMAGDLIAAMLQEIKLLPDIWPKLPELEQKQIIDRASSRVKDNIRAAVRRGLQMMLTMAEETGVSTPDLERAIKWITEECGHE